MINKWCWNKWWVRFIKYFVFELENVCVKWLNKNVFIVMLNNNIKSDMLILEILMRFCNMIRILVEDLV